MHNFTTGHQDFVIGRKQIKFTVYRHEVHHQSPSNNAWIRTLDAAFGRIRRVRKSTNQNDQLEGMWSETYSFLYLDKRGQISPKIESRPIKKLPSSAHIPNQSYWLNQMYLNAEEQGFTTRYILIKQCSDDGKIIREGNWKDLPTNLIGMHR